MLDGLGGTRGGERKKPRRRAARAPGWAGAQLAPDAHLRPSAADYGGRDGKAGMREQTLARSARQKMPRLAYRHGSGLRLLTRSRSRPVRCRPADVHPAGGTSRYAARGRRARGVGSRPRASGVLSVPRNARMILRPIALVVRSRGLIPQSPETGFADVGAAARGGGAPARPAWLP